MLTPDKIIEIFVKVDDFCKEFDVPIKKYRLEANAYKISTRAGFLTVSGMVPEALVYT